MYFFINYLNFYTEIIRPVAKIGQRVSCSLYRVHFTHDILTCIESVYIGLRGDVKARELGSASSQLCVPGHVT